MSIFAERLDPYFAQTAPIRLFTDRYDAVRAVARRINEDPPARTVGYFVGLPGSGKSSLLRHLREHCCFRLASDDWQEVSSYADTLFAASLARAPSAQPVPVASVDFGMRPDHEDRPQEPLAALFMLKRQLARHNVRTPRFDLAALTYFRKSAVDVSPRLADLFPAEERGLASDIADALLSLPVLRTVMDLSEAVSRRIDEVFQRRHLPRRVSDEMALRILSMPGEPDLADALPAIFSADLADCLTVLDEHERIVLMFDTYEALYGGTGFEPVGDPDGPRWFRSLLGNLPVASGVVAIVAGRVRPRWFEAAHESIPDRYVEFRSIGPLAPEFAETYLESAGVGQPNLRETLTGYASTASGQVHPFLLGLCADLVAVADRYSLSLDPSRLPHAIGLEDKARRLTARLLSWLGPDDAGAVVAAGACRSLDLVLFEHLGEALGFRHEADDFRRLTGFSFVTPATHAAPTPAPPATDSESLSGVYEVHRVLRQSVADVEPTAVRSAHQILVDYFQARAEHLLSRVESIYHRNQVDPADGVRAWLGAIQSALALGRFDFCRTYLALLPDLDVESDEELHACIYISARAAIGLGRWADAEDLLDDLPEGSAHALLLRADLAFLRGQFAPANALTKRALDGAPTGLPRLPFLFRVAELHLFLGYHDEARALCREAVMLAGGAEDRVLAANGQARFLNLAGEVAYFAGELDEARDTFRRAHEAIAAIAEEDRDQALQATLRQNDALVALTDGAWDAAALAQADALAIRRRIADARGIAHSLHGLGVAIAGSGDYPAAEASFSQAAEAATALGDDLLLGKINRARGEAALVAGKLDVARTALDQALAQLQRVGIDYDVAHAQLTMARLQHRLGREMTRVALWDDARRVIEPRKYLSLYTLFPEARVPSAERLYHGLLGLATGDALGVPWEGRPPAEIDEAEVARVPTRPGWPPGITSDDTTVVRVMSRHLIATNGRGDASGFLRALAAARTELRGIGETTRAALDRFVQTGRAERASDGATNGALVRALPVGWTYPRFATADRRELVELLTTTTHGDPVAIAAAQVIAVMASVAVEGVSLATVCSAAVDELTEQAHAHAEVAGALDAVRVWTPGPGGVEMTAAGTLGAVLHLLDHFPDEVALADAQLAAVSLGGDTDSVAAVVGGIVACRTADAGGQLPWIDRMALGDLEELHEIAEGLHALRQAAYREAPNE